MRPHTPSSIPANAFSKAEVLFDLEKYTECLEKLRQILAQNPDHYSARQLEILVYAQLKDQPQRQIALENFLADYPEVASGYYLQADYFFDRKKYYSARKAIKKALEIRPHDPDFLSFSALVELNYANFKKAKVLASQALAIEPDNLNGLYVMQHLNREDGQTKDALEVARRITAQNYSATTILHEADILFREGQKQEAIQTLERGIRDFPMSDALIDAYTTFRAVNTPILKPFGLVNKYFFIGFDQHAGRIGFYMGWILIFIVLRRVYPPLTPFVFGLLGFIMLDFLLIFILKKVYKKHLKSSKTS